MSSKWSGYGYIFGLSQNLCRGRSCVYARTDSHQQDQDVVGSHSRDLYAHRRRSGSVWRIRAYEGICRFGRNHSDNGFWLESCKRCARRCAKRRIFGCNHGRHERGFGRTHDGYSLRLRFRTRFTFSLQKNITHFACFFSLESQGDNRSERMKISSTAPLVQYHCPQ